MNSFQGLPPEILRKIRADHLDDGQFRELRVAVAEANDLEALARQTSAEPIVVPDARTMTRREMHEYLNNGLRVEIARRRHRTGMPRPFGL